MGGGLMQLVAYGAQDIYLTGNPQITFFKVVYRRHTNFSMESIAQTWSGSNTGTAPATGKCTATISRNGDLIHRMYLQVTGTGANGDLNPGSALINSVELEIGGQKIDKHTGEWMETWAELTQPNPTGRIGDIDDTPATADGTQFQRTTGMGGAANASSNPVTIFVPLQFWFCRNVGLALPLIALQYHEVKVILDWTATRAFNVSLDKNDLWVDYIYLDTDERRRFAQVSHEYLIEQVQEESWSTTDQTLNFNHPVKELIWTNFTTTDKLFSPAAMLTTSSYQLKLNGHDRFASRNLKYFTRVQVLQHHSGCGGLLAANSAAHGAFNDGIAVYSFALKPEEHQPSGTCNFSRIDNAVLEGSGTPDATKVYAVNYNVLRIMSGMGGLAYSN
jgi:hypothetical protein